MIATGAYVVSLTSAGGPGVAVAFGQPSLPTVSCEMGGVGLDGAPVTVDLVVVWQQVGR